MTEPETVTVHRKDLDLLIERAYAGIGVEQLSEDELGILARLRGGVLSDEVAHARRLLAEVIVAYRGIEFAGDTPGRGRMGDVLGQIREYLDPNAVMDYPAAWAFVRRTDMIAHDPSCNYRTSSGAVLCDCAVLHREHERRRAA